MKIVEPGHQYLLETYDNKTDIVTVQSLEFFKRIGLKYPGNVGKPHSGTNVQEVLRSLIDRTKYLNTQKHHVNNLASIEYMARVIWLFEDRAATEHKIDQFDFVPYNIELAPTCNICGHLVCNC